MELRFEFVDSNVEEVVCLGLGGLRQVSTVIIKLNGFVFKGKAFCHPDDYFSEFSGCKIAEMRAKRAALKFMLKQKQKEVHKLENFVKAVEGYKEFDKKSKTARCMYRQLNRYHAEVRELKCAIAHNKICEEKYIENLDNLNKSKEDKAKED